MTIFPADMRQRVRNPSIKMIAGIIIFLVAIAGGILGPTVIKDGIENYQEIRSNQKFEFADPIESWIRPWMVLQANEMLSAERPEQWRPHNFVFGPCSADNTRQLPTRELREAIVYSCGELARVQASHAAECPSTNQCLISEGAKEEIRAVVAVLDQAFGDAGLVLPYTTDEQPVE